jgi:hypothetical protein
MRQYRLITHARADGCVDVPMEVLGRGDALLTWTYVCLAQEGAEGRTGAQTACQVLAQVSAVRPGDDVTAQAIAERLDKLVELGVVEVALLN